MTRTEHHLLALLVWLKAYGRLGYFPDLFEVPPPIVEHIRGLLEFKPVAHFAGEAPETDAADLGKYAPRSGRR